MDQRHHRHSWPEKDTKRQLSPHPIDNETKKVKSIYIVESPGGTLHETSPTKVYQPDMQKLRISSLPARPAVKPEPGSPAIKDEQLRQLSVRETLLKGIAIGFGKAQAQDAMFRAMWQRDPLLNIYQPPEHITTVAGMQNAADRAIHLAPRLSPERIDSDSTEVQGPSETVHPVLTAKGPGKGERRSVVKVLMAQHYWHRRFYA